MVDFEANPMKGTSFDIGDDDEEPLTRSNSSKSILTSCIPQLQFNFLIIYM